MSADLGMDSRAVSDVCAAAGLLAAGNVAVLTGAGLSTDSGIPDYRSPGRPPHRPMTHSEFCGNDANRQRYWARSFIGFAAMQQARPNAGHQALARLEHAALTTTLITQNVDGLHGVAGQRRVIDLHGRIDQVVCLTCAQITSREAFQNRLHRLNPDFRPDADLVIRPDGDVELDDTAHFRVPGCLRCTGVLKPRVVFFGDSVPKSVVGQCFSLVERSSVLLVAGSSLTVMSGLRFVRHAAKHRIPVIIVNRGATRGDELARIKIDAGCSEVLTDLAEALAT